MRAALLAIFALCLISCGGGGGGSSAAPAGPPAPPVVHSRAYDLPVQMQSGLTITEVDTSGLWSDGTGQGVWISDGQGNLMQGFRFTSVNAGTVLVPYPAGGTVTYQTRIYTVSFASGSVTITRGAGFCTWRMVEIVAPG